MTGRVTELGETWNQFGGRRTEARTAARSLVEAFEADAGIEVCLMKAQRLARLLRDTDAQLWLDCETRGYAEDFDLKAARVSSTVCVRKTKKGLITVSLPEMEARVRGAEAILDKMQSASIKSTAKDYVESGATAQVIAVLTRQIVAARDAYTSTSSSFSRMRSHLYRYAADTLVALEFGDVAEQIFESARSLADKFIRRHAPKAAAQLLAAEERMMDATAESLSACLTSCRRVLSTIADAVFPAQSKPYVDAGGRSRKVGEAEYLNRLLAFVETRVESGSTRSILDSQLSHLGARLDAVYGKACKGVHDDVTIEEARLVLVQTYLFLAEVARITGPEAAADISDSGIAVPESDGGDMEDSGISEARDVPPK